MTLNLIASEALVVCSAHILNFKVLCHSVLKLHRPIPSPQISQGLQLTSPGCDVTGRT